MRIVFEAEARGFELASAFDVHPVKAIDQNIGNSGILEKRLQGPETEDLIENFSRQAFALGKAQRNSFTVDGVTNQQQDFFPSGFVGSPSKLLQVEPVEDLAMEVGFDLLVLSSFESLRSRHELFRPS